MHDSRGASLRVGDRVLVEGVVDSVSADNGYCNAYVKFVTPEQMQGGENSKPPMTPPGDTFNTRMLTKIGAAILLLFAGCSLLATAPCNAQAFSPTKKMDGHNDANGRSMYNAGRMPEMPSGPNKLHCWIVVSDNWQKNPLEFALAQTIANDPRMQQIKAGTYFNYYTVSNPKFAQSGLVSAVGTATPIVVVTQNDGAIKGDGSNGLFVNAQSCPNTADGVVDMLCDALGAMNPPPRVEGQTMSTQIVREAQDCGPNCTPAPSLPAPNLKPALTPVRPRPQWDKYLAYAGYFLIGCAIFMAFLAGLMIVALIAGSLFQRLRSSRK